jgi:hypothetical protein
VVASARLLDRAALDRLLAVVERDAMIGRGTRTSADAIVGAENQSRSDTAAPVRQRR